MERLVQCKRNEFCVTSETQNAVSTIQTTLAQTSKIEVNSTFEAYVQARVFFGISMDGIENKQTVASCINNIARILRILGKDQSVRGDFCWEVLSQAVSSVDCLVAFFFQIY